MNVKKNKQLVDHLLEVFNAHNWDRYARLLTESTIFRHPNFSEPQTGIIAFQSGGTVRKMFEAHVIAFPDVHFEIEHVFGENNWICVEGALIGTHSGPLHTGNGQTVPATHNPVRIPICNVFKIKGEKIAAQHIYYNRLTIRIQLGLA